MDNLAQQPPKWIDKLLSSYCSAQRFEELTGDLHELYHHDVKQYGKQKANRKYLFNTLKCMRPYAYKMKKNPHYKSNSTDMILNNITIALRRLTRQWSYSLLNILGLTIGIVCFTFIYLYVNHELSYDQFHEKKANLYTTPFTWHFGSTTLPTARATSNVGPLLKNRYSEVKNYVRLTPTSKVLRHGNVVGEESSFIYVDSSFFQMFSFKLIAGNEFTALNEPKSIVLTESIAEKYFGREWRAEELLGSTIIVGAKDEYKITGIAQNAPENSHIQFDILASINTFPNINDLDNFNNSAYLTYVELQPNTNVSELKTKIINDLKEQFQGELPVEIGLKPFSDIYLNYGLDTGVGPISSMQTIYIFSGIGLLIIIIACINYMNLATARSVEGAKEIGVRKVMGAGRTQLIGQFLGESFLMTLVSILISLLVLYISLPLFNALADKSLTVNLFTNLNLTIFLFSVWLLVSLIAGFYPAFALSGFSITGILRGRFKYSNTGSALRKLLVTIQFTVSVILIVATLVIYKQLSFVTNKNLGYDKELIISLPLDPQSRPQISFLKQKLGQLASVKSTSVTGQLPSRITHETTISKKDGEENRQLLRNSYIDNDYVETLGLELLAGDKMSDSNSDTYEFVLNESAANFFGWTANEAIGQKLKIWNSEWGNVTGVVKDFHFSSLHEKIKPLLLYNLESDDEYGRNNLLIRLETEDMSGALSAIEGIWNQAIDFKPFEYTFLVDKLDSSYKKESHLNKLIMVFALLAIFIGCLGLFGLVSYTAYQRSKEIGIRKVLGATVGNIVIILSKGFSKQIIISLVIGILASYFIMEQWLQSFEYKTNIGIDVILLASVVTVGIAFFTMSFKSIQAAMQNPADSLKIE